MLLDLPCDTSMSNENEMNVFVEHNVIPKVHMTVCWLEVQQRKPGVLTKLRRGRLADS